MFLSVAVCANFQSLGLNISSLRSALKKPLRPSWVTPDDCLSKRDARSTGYHSIVCCTASHRVGGTENSENGYIQGAGDDSETWSYGLTPDLFWRHKSQLLGTVEGNMADTIHRIIQADVIPVSDHGSAVKLGSTELYIGRVPDATQFKNYDGIIICSSVPPQSSISNNARPEQKQILHFLCVDGKLGSRALRVHFQRLLPFVASLPYHAESPRILFACSTGRDLSVGVALTVLATFFNDDCKSPLELHLSSSLRANHCKADLRRNR